MKKKVWALAAIVMGMMGHAQAASAFDFDNELAPFTIGFASIPAIYEASPTGGDATLVLRSTMRISNAWFDATAPYSDTGVALYHDIPRRPAAERTQANQNIACFYASFHVLMSLYPQHETEWRNLLLDAGLDPDDGSLDPTTPIGIGNLAGEGVVIAQETDGLNQLGTANGRNRYPKPFEDTTGYVPVNTPYELKDPSRWQPQMNTNGLGIFFAQQYVTPQLGRAVPFAGNPKNVVAPRPAKSDWKRNKNAYRQQAEQVIAESAAITDERKMLAELFNDKIPSLGGSTAHMIFSRGLTLRQAIEIDFLVMTAKWDTGIAIWANKSRYDAVRPTSAIRFLKEGQEITAYGGKGAGVVDDLKGEHFESYLPVADHPEYPSGSQGFCSAHAAAMRTYFGDDNLGWTVTFPAGSSRFEPGITPATTISYTFETWTEFEEVCGLTRNWAGVHFLDAVYAARPIGRNVGSNTANVIMSYIDGTIADDGDDDDDDDCGDGHHGHHGHH